MPSKASKYSKTNGYISIGNRSHPEGLPLVNSGTLSAPKRSHRIKRIYELGVIIEQ